ncbi:MAG TPA: hypothetical protein VE619_03350 [Nitrososphaeraceae archaeon]|nr:hypothetical protein [Nitrososphaeraceae archaeon]
MIRFLNSNTVRLLQALASQHEHTIKHILFSELASIMVVIVIVIAS